MEWMSCLKNSLIYYSCTINILEGKKNCKEVFLHKGVVSNFEETLQPRYNDRFYYERSHITN